jgi:hypothetical protein
MTTVAAWRMCGIAPVENARFCHAALDVQREAGRLAAEVERREG